MTCFCSVCFPKGMIKSDWLHRYAQIASSLALVLTSLLLVSLAPAFPVAAEDEIGRSTGNEEVSFQPLSSKYYDRGGDITFTVTAKNLDPNTEYTLDWEICNTGSSYDYDCDEFIRLLHQEGPAPLTWVQGTCCP